MNKIKKKTTKMRVNPKDSKRFFWVLLIFVLIIGIWIGVQGANQGVLTLATSAQGLTNKDGDIKVRVRAIDAMNMNESLYAIDQTATVQDGQLKLRWQIPPNAKKKAAYIEICAMDKRAGPSASVKKSCIENSGEVAYNKVSCPYYVPANSTGFSGQLNGWNKLDDSQKVGCNGYRGFSKVSSLKALAEAQSPGIRVEGGGVLVAENGKIATKNVEDFVKDALSGSGNTTVQVTTNVPVSGPQGQAGADGANGVDGVDGADGAVGIATVSGGGLILTGQNLSLDDSCIGGQVLQWDGSVWECASVAGTDSQTLSLAANVLAISGGNSVNLSGYLDNTDSQALSWVGGTRTLSLTGSGSVVISDSDTTYSAGNGLSLGGTTFSINSPTCAGTDKLTWSGTAFSCVADVDTDTDTDTGVTTIGTIDSQTKSANGAVISGTSLVLQTADGSNPGLVSTTTQTFAGDKTFSGSVTANGDVTLGDAAADGITITGEIRGSSPLAFEGATNDGVYTTFAITDPTLARTVTFPDRSGTVSLSGDTFIGDVTGTLNASGATTLTIAADSVSLGTDTTGDYVSNVTAGGGLTGSATGEGSTPTLAIVSANGGITVNADDIALTIASSADALSATTSSGSGLEVLASGLTLLQGCSDTQVLAWNETTDVWACATNTDTGVTTIGTIDSQAKSANGAVISGNTLYLQTADVTNVGLVSTGTQTFAGDKTFSGNVIANGSLTANGDVTLGDATTDGLTFSGEVRGASPLAFEGATNDGVYTTFAITDPTLARTITFPDASGTVCLQGSTSCAFISTTLADGQILIGNGSNVATAVTPTGDVTISNTGVTAIQADSVVLGTDTTGNYVADVTGGTGISIAGSLGEGWTPTINLANTTVAAASYSAADNANGSIAIPQFTVDAQGRLTSASTANITPTGIANSQLANSSLTITAGAGLANGGAVSLGGTVALDIGAGNGITVNANDITIDLTAATDALSATTSSGSGLEVLSTGLTLVQGCSDTQVLAWNETTDVWACSTPTTAVTTVGTIDSQTKSANGAVISGNTLYMQNADATYPGLVSTGTQTLAGAKTLTGNLTATGTALFQNATDSTSAFQINSAAGDGLIRVDTLTTENLITNGQFETNTTGWAAKGSSTISQTSSQKYLGTGSMQITNTAAANDGAKYDYALTSQTQYTMTFYVKNTTLTSSYSTINIGRTEDGSTDNDCATGQTINGAGWSKITCTFNTGNVTGTNHIYIKQTDAIARTMYIDSVELQTSTNLATNPDVEVDASGWGYYGSISLSQTATQAYTGSGSLQADTSATAGLEGPTLSPSVQPNTTYTISAWVQLDAGTGSSKTFGIYKRFDSADSGSGTSCTTASLAPGTWTKMTCTFTTGNVTSGSPFIAINTTDDGVTPITFYVDNVALSVTKWNSNDIGRISLNGAIDSPLTVRGAQDSTSALQVQQQNGTNILTVDTLNGRVGINTAAPTKTLEVNGKILFKATNTDTDTFQIQNTSTTNNVAFNVAASSRAVTVGASTNTANGSLSVYGTGLVKTMTSGGSASAFSVQDSSNANVLTVSTASGNKLVYVGEGGIDSKFQIVNTGSTAALDIGTTGGGYFESYFDDFKVFGSGGGLTFASDGVANTITIGDADDASAAATTLFIVDSASTANLPVGVNGGIVYDSQINKFKIYEGGAYKTLCNTTDLACAVGDGGVTSIGTIDSQTKSADGAVISGTSLVMQNADATYPGLVSTGTQTFAGDKAFNGGVTIGTVGTPSGQLFVSGSVPSAAAGSVSGGTNPYRLHVQGSYAYVVDEGGNALKIYDITNPASPALVSSVATGTAPYDVYVKGSQAYVVNRTSATLQVFDVSNPASPAAIGSVATQVATPEEVEIYGNYAYVSGAGGMVEAYDVSDPKNPLYVTYVSFSTDYAASFAQGRYMYLIERGSDLLEIYDISKPDFPNASGTLVGSVSTGAASNPSSIFIQGKYAYITNEGTDTLGIYNITNPAAPASVGTVSTGTGPKSVYVQGRYAYVANSTGNTLQIIDVSNPASPTSEGTVAASGANSVSVKGRYAYVAQSGSNTLDVYDVGGAYIQQLETGGIKTGSLDVSQALNVDGALTVNGATKLSGDLQVQDSTGAAGLLVDTTKREVSLSTGWSGDLVEDLGGNYAFTIGTEPASVVVNGYMYMVGGGSTVQYGKIMADGTVPSVSTTTSLPASKTRLAAVAHNGYMYAIGGGTSNTVYFSRINADGTLGSWKSTTSLTTSGTNHSAAIYKGNLYVVSSGSGNPVIHAKINPDGTIGSWTTSSMTGGTRPQIIVVNSKLYEFSGQSTDTVQYASIGSDGTLSGVTTGSFDLPIPVYKTRPLFMNGYLYAFTDDLATPQMYYAKVNSDGTIGSWNTTLTNMWAGGSGSYNYPISAYNGYVYAAGEKFYTSGRTLVGGTLDLTSLGRQDMNSGAGVGASLNAGNTNIVGSLDVVGQTSLMQGLSVAGDVNVAGQAVFQNTTDTTSAFRVQTSGGNSIVSIDTATTPNLVTNQSFELNTDGWAARTSATLTKNTTEKYVGKSSMQVVTGAAANNGTKYNYALASTTTYSLSFYAKSGGTFTTMQVGRTDNGTTGSETNCLTGQTVSTTNWTRYTCTFTTGATSGTPYIYIKQSDAAAHTYYIDGVQLEAASASTNFKLGGIEIDGVLTSHLIMQNSVDSAEAFKVQNAAGTTVLGVDTLTSGVAMNGTITDTGQLTDINLTLGDDAGVDTVSALNIDVTSANTGDADNLYGLNVANLTGADSNVLESAINVGTGWDKVFDSANVDISQAGVISGATGITSSGAITFSGLANCANLTTDGSGVVACGTGPDSAAFTDSTPVDYANNTTTALFDDGTKPNITPISSSSTVLVSVHSKGRGASTTDSFAAVRIVREDDVGSTTPACDGTDPQVGDILQTSMTTNNASSDLTEASGTFLDSPASTAAVYYQVCSNSLTATQTHQRLDVVLVVLGADYAENYYTKDDSVEAGDIVSIDSSLPAGAKKSSGVYDRNVIGIVSTAPGKVLDDKVGATQGRPIPVALSGRVPVKVSTENGSIKVGDLLTASSIPGVAMKATKAGQIVGQAMTTYSGSGVGQVFAFVKTDYANGTSIDDLIAGFDLPADQLAGSMNSTNLTLLTGLMSVGENPLPSATLSDIVTDRIAAGVEVVTPKLTTDKLAVNTFSAATGQNVRLELGNAGQFIISNADNKDVITMDQEGNAQFSGTITADKIKANHIEGLEVLVGKIGILDDLEAIAESRGSTSSSVRNIGDDLSGLKTDIEYLKGYKDILSIETLGEASIKKGIFIADVQFRKQVQFLAQAHFTSDVIVDGKLQTSRLVVTNNTGNITIQPGQTEVQVYFLKPLDSKPNVFLSTENPDVKAVAKDRLATGFIIKLSEPLTEPLEVQWFAVEKE